MEGLIIFIIVSLIGYFFSDKKGEKSQRKIPVDAQQIARIKVA